MSLKHKLISVFASALVLGSAAVIVSAQDAAPPVTDGATKAEKHGRKGFGRRGGFGKGMHGGEFRGMRGLMGVELTDTQKAQIKQIHEANRPDQASMDEMKSLAEARRGGTLTEDQKVRAKALRDQMRTRAESVHQQVLAVLTPEQRQQLEVRKAERQKRMEERRNLRQQRKQQSTAPSTVNKSTDLL